MDVSFDLTVAWAALLAAAIFIYVALDGFDLGVGILYPVFPAKRERDLMMNSLAPVWDGNETWLILGGGGLFAAFPLAYAILMPALYLPVLAMLLALVFRGVAFEFRGRASTEGYRKMWEAGFFGGSTLAAFSQGVILGGILQGVAVEGRSFAGGPWDWATPFAALTGLALVAGYALLGACWLNIKMEGEIQARARRAGRVLALAVLGFLAAVSVATPFLEQEYAARWFAWPTLIFSALVPALVAGAGWALWRALAPGARRDWPAMLWALAIFALAFAGIGLSIWPYVVPTEVTIWQAATPFYSQIFMFVGAVVLIPLILAYTGYAYWVFRGKTGEEGYH
jgi:cytochrome d ubiquinol oxidase subunit II